MVMMVVNEIAMNRDCWNAHNTRHAVQHSSMQHSTLHAMPSCRRCQRPPKTFAWRNVMCCRRTASVNVMLSAATLCRRLSVCAARVLQVLTFNCDSDVIIHFGSMRGQRHLSLAVSSCCQKAGVDYSSSIDTAGYRQQSRTARVNRSGGQSLDCAVHLLLTDSCYRNQNAAAVCAIQIGIAVWFRCGGVCCCSSELLAPST